MWFNEWFGSWHGQWYGDTQESPEPPDVVCDFVVNYPEAQIQVFGFYDVEETTIRQYTNRTPGLVSLADITVNDSTVAINCANNVQETTVKGTENNVAELVVKVTANKAVTTKSRPQTNTVTVVKNDCG